MLFAELNFPDSGKYHPENSTEGSLEQVSTYL